MPSQSRARVMGSRPYTCRAGDSFDLLAGQAYGQETMASVIVAENPDYCDTVLFEGGEVIALPLVERVESPDTLPPWRR